METLQNRAASNGVDASGAANEQIGPTERLASAIAAGGPVEVPFDENDFGSELIPILSEGLYSDPRDCIREILQNAIDAGSSDAWVEFRGRDVAVTDIGSGMDLSMLLELKRIAKSSKMGTRAIGFRGIGVYAAFSVCDRMHIATQTAHDDVQFTMTFDFERMRQILDGHRVEPGREQESAAQMLRECVTIMESEVDPLDTGRTVVTLENVAAEKFRELHEIESFEEYLTKNVPIAFEPNEYTEKIDRELAALVPGYRTLRVHLVDRLQDLDREVRRRLPPTVGEPVFLPMQPRETVQAIIWACIADKTADKASGKRKRRLEDGGLVFKMHGIAIGNRENVRPLFNKEQVYEWCFGEVHVVTEEVKPNTARNDFEQGPARQRLHDFVEGQLSVLGGIATHRWTIARAREVFEQIEPQAQALHDEIERDSAHQYVSHHYAEIQRLRTSLRKQRLPKLPEADPVRKQGEKIAKMLESSTALLPVQIPGASATEAPAGRSTPQSPSSAGATETKTPAPSTTRGDDVRTASGRTRHETRDNAKTLSLFGILEHAGVDTKAPAKVIGVIEAALDEVLPHGTEGRRAFEAALRKTAEKPSA